MTDFTLDTSGAVFDVKAHTRSAEAYVRWPDLSPFEQGYGGAMAQELYDRLIREGWPSKRARIAVAFRKWHPETLAAIRKDCARFQSLHENAPDGGRFYRARQKGLFVSEAFPPLTVSLGDDGKVYARVSA